MKDHNPDGLISGADMVRSVAERLVRAAEERLAESDTAESRENAALARRNLVRVLTMDAAQGGEP